MNIKTNEIVFQLTTNNYVNVMDSDGNNYILDHMSSFEDHTVFAFDQHGEEVELDLNDLDIIQ